MDKRYASPTSKIHVSRNVMMQKIWVFSIRRFTDLRREINKGSIKSKYFQKSFHNRFRRLNWGLETCRSKNWIILRNEFWCMMNSMWKITMEQYLVINITLICKVQVSASFLSTSQSKNFDMKASFGKKFVHVARRLVFSWHMQILTRIFICRSAWKKDFCHLLDDTKGQYCFGQIWSVATMQKRSNNGFN